MKCGITRSGFEWEIVKSGGSSGKWSKDRNKVFMCTKILSRNGIFQKSCVFMGNCNGYIIKLRIQIIF